MSSLSIFAGLPYGKIPDRKDFKNFDYDSRLAYWREVLEKSRILADEFDQLLTSGKVIDNIKPFSERDSMKATAK